MIRNFLSVAGMKHLLHPGGAKFDVALTTAGITSMAWAPFITAFDQWAPRIMLLGGIVLLGLRIYILWTNRDSSHD